MKLEQLLFNIKIPLPTKQIVITEQTGEYEIEEQFNRFFDDVISVYSKEIQIILKDMYYLDEKVSYDTIKDPVGAWRTKLELDDSPKYKIFENDVKFKYENCVILNSGIKDNIVLKLSAKIHEIGIHAGQFYEIFGENGKLSINEFKDFNIATELSAMIVDSMIYNMIPEKIMTKNLPEIQSNFIKKSYEENRKKSFRTNKCRKKHEAFEKLPDGTVEQFTSRLDASAFINYIFPNYEK